MGLAGVLNRLLGPYGFRGMLIVCIILWIVWWFLFDNIWFLGGVIIVSALTVILGVSAFKKMMRNAMSVDESDMYIVSEPNVYQNTGVYSEYYMQPANDLSSAESS
jgi:membrane protein YdbS with pleckstrin-like domain